MNKSNEYTFIHEISAAQTRVIRQRVLRPHQRAEELVYPGDDAPSSFHLGAMNKSEELVAILSMYRESMNNQDDGWRIRGMASTPEARGLGYGRLLVDRACTRAWTVSRTRVWCNARESAFGFYEKLGFVIEGDVFDIEGIGPHAVMTFDPNQFD